MRARPYQLLRRHEKVDSAVRHHGSGVESLLPVLQEVQKADGHLSVDALGAISDAVGVSDAHTFGAATFYSMLSTQPQGGTVIRVCDGPVCRLAGGDIARAALDQAVAAKKSSRDCCVTRTSCLGQCDRAPAALVDLDPCGPIEPSLVHPIFSGWRGGARSYQVPLSGELRVAMERIGRVNPSSIESAIDHGAYEPLKSALKAGPQTVLEAITQSGLQGRGGAGFPTGRKWRFVAQAAGTSKYGGKYVVCNADESEPAAFKDRVLMEGDPHLLLEGMVLAGFAVGASQGYIYIRGEYEHAAKLLEQAIRQAAGHGFIGEDILGSGFSFSIHVHRGAGAYICGEETALLESLEGRRGEPRLRPPYPTTCGLYGKPTVVNNVETLCKAPAIIARGPKWYRSLGTASSPGTKMFTVTGHVNRPGAFEAPFGITLRQVIEQFGGGMKNGSTFKMALTGGAAGTIVGEEALDTPLDFAAQFNPGREGVSLGSGAILVMDQSVSVVELLEWLLHFFEMESCGKCTPCREGTSITRRLVSRGRAAEPDGVDVKQLANLAKMLRLTSLCGLGQSVAWPIESALKNFPEEFRANRRAGL